MLEYREEHWELEDFLTVVSGRSPLGIQEWFYGTCRGQYSIKDKKIVILSIYNDEPHNGNFALSIEYFRNKAKEKHYDFVIGELMNERLYRHFIKLGFKPFKKYNGVIKKWGEL